MLVETCYFDYMSHEMANQLFPSSDWSTFGCFSNGEVDLSEASPVPVSSTASGHTDEPDETSGKSMVTRFTDCLFLLLSN